MTESSPERDKAKVLREARALNPRPHLVVDETYGSHPFFDVHDLVQVKYEMVRRVRIEGQSVSQASSAFGFSRPSFHQAQEALERGGLPELVPLRRGPRGGHKLTDEVLEFVEQVVAKNPSFDLKALAQQVEERFGRRVHPRSIQRGLERRQKKPKNPGGQP